MTLFTGLRVTDARLRRAPHDFEPLPLSMTRAASSWRALQDVDFRGHFGTFFFFEEMKLVLIWQQAISHPLVLHGTSEIVLTSTTEVRVESRRQDIVVSIL
jgi:hypothetical protein